MRLYKLILFLWIAIVHCNIYAGAQTKKTEELTKKITAYNDAFQYERSIRLLSDFISDNTVTPYEKYEAYILKSYTYKRLFNYTEAMINLDMAHAEGKKSHKAKEAENIIKAEKAFIYFDTQDYDKAAQLMDELAKTNYAYLLPDNKAFIIMQEGSLLMRKKKYFEAEKKLDESIAITKIYAPRNLANIYGKKIELYNAMKLYDKRDAAFDEGIRAAKQYKVLKYEMYLYEVSRNLFQKNNDYKNAFEAQKKYDSLNRLYSAINNNGKIQLLEKQIYAAKKEQELKNERSIKFFLISLIFVLALLLFLSYRLYIISKQKRRLVEKENKRIRTEIQTLAKRTEEQGGTELDFSKFGLTERQMEVVRLVRSGNTNKEIAAKLFISENTVKYHLKIIYETMNIEHRIELK